MSVAEVAIPARMGGDDRDHQKVQVRLGCTLVFALFSVIVTPDSGDTILNSNQKMHRIKPVFFFVTDFSNESPELARST